ncbi:MAG: hypothetical protein RM049_21015 [Nostoc sp. DedQUE04]|nr:hypothetical protein [Nostoc sp. DedQUE04]MDZ8137753.1 hypothetical protein [Nostoc sp. DedQUE04]
MLRQPISFRTYRQPVSDEQFCDSEAVASIRASRLDSDALAERFRLRS